MIQLPYSQDYKYQVFLKTKVGFEFEFYSDLNERTLASIFKNLLGKKVVLGRSKKSFSKSKLGYHTSVAIDDNTFKLEKDYSGGAMMYELVTSPLGYFESIKILQLTLAKLKEVGWVNDLSGIHINISYTDKEYDLHFINILKFCVNFKDIETQIFKDFPTRKKNIYAESITKLLPDYSMLTLDSEDLNINNTKINLPLNSRYFGVNFQHLKDKYLEYRYIGGRDYLNKSEKILNYLEVFTLFGYDQMVNQTVTDSDNINFRVIVDKYFEKMKHFKNFETFMKAFPNIHLSVDLKYQPEYIVLKFNEFKEVLYNLIVNNGMKEGYINYDSDASILQVKDATIERGIDLSNIEFVTSTISGVFEKCFFFNCVIKSSMLFGCSLNMGSEVEDSKIMDTRSNTGVVYKQCFVRNDYTRLSGTFEKCVVVGSREELEEGSTYDDQTLFVDRDASLGKKKK
jgi:hypothetical protein